MTPRLIVGLVSMGYGVAVLAMGASNHPAVLLVGLALLGVFVAVDGWQTRRDDRRSDCDQVRRILDRQETHHG